MEGVEGLMRNLWLLAVEKTGLKIGSKGKSTEGSGGHVQVLGKVMSEKLIHAETVEQALGKELLVVADVERKKTLDEIEFVYVPIWIRIMNLPIGLRNKEAGMTIEKEIGELMLVDMEGGDVPIKRFLRVRVRLDIRKPLMRGVTVDDDYGNPDRWCPLVYEYLPNFCYICGIIGHTERTYSIHLQEGEAWQFDKSLHFIPPRGRTDGEALRRVEMGRSAGWRPSSNAGHGRSEGSGGRWRSNGSHSDAPSWKKSNEEGGRVVGRKDGEKDEVTSPLKAKDKNVS
ncbi:hypothetical protein GQ55_4G144300 [Panicum hallii var. hallii]|uniref:Zinc knuckle CX2CX4HX4C domain-containing protein n=1 Tax=Panicum hallii var. hallii TaxID=1504633 RepID=A0A2T7DYB1_9POAL|nr:hypothetical protein GQ55_4G144300 [Panicum hallii var. hallii]